MPRVKRPMLPRPGVNLASGLFFFLSSFGSLVNYNLEAKSNLMDLLIIYLCGVSDKDRFLGHLCLITKI